MDNNDKYENSALRIFNQVRAIHERFIQSKILVENAKQHLSAQKNLTATQCKRATQSFFELDDSIGKLYNLLRQQPLPEIIDSQRHRIILKLQSLEPYKDELSSRINAFSLTSRIGHREEIRNKQEDFIVSIQTLIKKLDELISVLNTILTLGTSPTSATEQVMSETDVENNEQEPLPRLIVPSQALEHPPQQVFSSMPPFVLILIRNTLDILIRLFAPGTTRTNPPLDVPNVTQEIIYRNPLPGTIVSIVATENGERFNLLYNNLNQHIEPLQLELICRKVDIPYLSLDDKSHETRAYSLTKKMENQNRLDELEQELRILLPNRFTAKNQQ